MTFDSYHSHIIWADSQVKQLRPWKVIGSSTTMCRRTYDQREPAESLDSKEVLRTQYSKSAAMKLAMQQLLDITIQTQE